MKKDKLNPSVFFLINAPLYTLLLHFTPKNNFPLIIGCYTLLFISYGIFIRQLERKKISLSPTLIIISAILLRLIATLALPELSDDFYRFVWDGRILANGGNPFAQVPTQAIQLPQASQWQLTPELYQSLNSPDYFTIYPPVCQFIFWVSALIFPSNIYGALVVMKSFVLLAEIGTLYFIYRLLQYFHKPTHLLAIYAFNPLVIAELNGSLHFEALMICFLMMSIWWMISQKWFLSSLTFALAVCSKLLPLMFLPLLIPRIGLKKSILYGISVGIISLILFLPLFNLPILQNLFQSIRLYFQHFEFNASLYYILRWIGFQLSGHNLIAIFGRILPIIALIGILRISWREKEARWESLFTRMLWIYTLYFALATTVHPWYITPMVAFATFSTFRYPLIWTALIPLTYIAYSGSSYHENLWVVAFEYLLVFGWMGYEYWIRKKPLEYVK